jgi:hypothetical protein
MIYFGIFVVLAMFAPGLLELILRFCLFFLSLVLGSGVGMIAWAIAGCMGYADHTWSSFLTYCALFGIPTTIFIFSQGS